MSDNAAGFAALEREIAALRRLAGLAKACAKPVAEALKEDAARRIAAGVAPSGAPWQPTKEGKQPLRNAAKALTATAVDAVAILRLDGVEARHHRGSARGNIRRPILPGRADLGAIAPIVRRVAAEQFAKLHEGAA